jgi:hypothetical protein
VASGVVWVSLVVFVTTSDGMQDGGGVAIFMFVEVCEGSLCSLRRFLFVVWVSDHHDGGLQ